MSQHTVDRLAVNIFGSLTRDFRTLLGQPDFAKHQYDALARSVADFREVSWPLLGEMPVTRFKAWWQLRHLLKRHRFGTDIFSDDELSARTLQSYTDFSCRRSVYTQFKLSTNFVLREARKVCREILGNFDSTEDLYAVKIGRRATLGGALHNAYLDDKLTRPSSFTCPTALKSWFFTHVLGDPVLRGLVKNVFKTAGHDERPDLSADYLNLVLVPKSWKTLRAISPLSLIGLYYSFWVGHLVTKRLKENAGLDIRHLQESQKRLARRASVKGHLVTADLSSASDSLRSDILNRVLPRAWYNAIKATFIRQISIDTGLQYTEAVLPMGNGVTFPVETLVFYCLLKAIGRLTGTHGTFSVYGDDLIYPKRIHPYVLRVFADLGLGINEDKTFADSAFRESCGGDYYHGFDVRPALLPEAPDRHLTGTEYAAYLYTILNSLLVRWTPYEIPQTVRLLELELLTVQKEILQVPKSFPATSGRQTDVPLASTWYLPYAQPKSFFKNGSAYIAVRLLRVLNPKKRPVISETPYYWDKLRSMAARKPDWRSSFGWFKRLNAPMQLPTTQASPLDVLWLKGKRICVCPCNGIPPYRVQIDQVSNWS